MPPKPPEKDLNLFHGDDLYDDDALKQRMAFFTGRKIATEERSEIEDAFTYEGDDLEENLTGAFGPQALRHCVFTTLVGYNFDFTLDTQTNAVVIVRTRKQKNIAGAAFLRNDQYFHRDPNTGEFRRNPQVSVLAFGIDSPQVDDALEPSVLEAMICEVRAYAENTAITLQPVLGTRAQNTFVPTVSLHPLAQMKPTLPAKAINESLSRVITNLNNVFGGTPRMGTGFGNHVEGLRFALEALKTEHPNHPVAQAVTECASLQKASTSSSFGSESDYQQAQRIAGATHTLLKALRFGINTYGDTLYPETCGDPSLNTTVISEPDDGSITLRIYNKGRDEGTVSLITQSLDETSPMFDFHHTPIDGMTSDAAGAALRSALKGKWFRKRTQRMK